MATTTNYGWTTPDNTALVKDGADAIRTLGSSIDTSMNTALGTKKAGIVLLNTTSFSGVASQSVNDVFSTTYDNYKIVSDLTYAASGSLRMKLRVGGADDSNNVYRTAYGYEEIGGAGTGRVTDGATTSWALSQSANTAASKLSLDIYGPFLTQVTFTNFLQTTFDGGSGYIFNGGMTFTNTTSFTGFTIIAGASTITGKISVYGYNK